MRHQRIVDRLLYEITDFVNRNDLGEAFPGPLDVLFAEGDYLEPDIVFIGTDRAHLLSDRGVEGPPDLVVEVLSPSTADRDRGAKLERYRHYGVREYWIVDPDARTVEVWKLAEGADRPVVRGPSAGLDWTPAPGATLTVDLPELFAD